MQAQHDVRFQEKLERAREAERFFDAHRDFLIATYPEQWVAIYGEQVVAASDQLEDLMARLEGTAFPLGHVFIDLASEDGEFLLIAGP